MNGNLLTTPPALFPIMNRSVSLLYRTTGNAVLQQTCRRQFIPLRRYVNWTPDKSTNKKGKIPPTSPPQKPPPPTGDSQSPAELNKAFQPPSAVDPVKSDPNPEPQLLRLKNNKTFNQWEQEWNERVWRAGQLTLILGVFVAAYAIGAGYIHLPYGMNYRASTLPEAGSEEEIQYLKRVEGALHSLPIVQELSKDRDWIKTVGIFPIPKEDAPHNLVMGSLAGTGKITVKPVTFYNDKTKESVVVMHVGQDVCGHRGLVHGGFLATMLDECLGKTVMPFKDPPDKRLLQHYRGSLIHMGRDDKFGLKIESSSLQISI
jgi:hypothetical protein